MTNAEQALAVAGADTLVALEPGTDPGPWGLRVEQIVPVADTGSETLSRHELVL